MLGIEITFDQIQSAVASFYAIPAASFIVSLVVALGIVPMIAGVLYKIADRS